MYLNAIRLGRARSSQLLALLGAIFLITQAHAAPTIVSVVPASGATGVSTTATVVFTFSEAMDTNATSATFVAETGGSLISGVSLWSAGNTVLTFTPASAWPSGTIEWIVSGQDTGGNSLGVPVGTFTVSGSSGGGGGNPCGAAPRTNTSLTLEESWLYLQTSASAPVLEATPYAILAEVALDSNLTASAATLTLPGGAVSNLTFYPIDSGVFLATDAETNLTTLDTTWPNGTYTFTLSGTSPSFPSVPVSWNIAQPNVPTIANWAAAQAVDPTQPFTLAWNSFSNRVVNTNEISINIGYDPCAGTGFVTNLPGGATSVTIPANVLVPGSNYVNSSIVFINTTGTTSASPAYTAGGVRGTATSFTLTTIGAGGTGATPSLSIPAWTGSAFTFTVSGSAGATVTVQYSSTLQPGSWATLKTLSNPSGTLNVTDIPPTGTPVRFYRVHQ